MEIINWQEHDKKGGFYDHPNLVAYTLLEGMSRAAGTDVKEVFAPFNPEALEVELKVNGVVVPFTWVMGEIEKCLNNMEQTVEKSLQNKIKGQIADKLYEMIDEL